MKLDENEFFRQATLRICSSLDIDKALSNFLSYIRLFIPVFQADLSMLDPSAGILSNLANVDEAGGKKTLPPTPLPRAAIQELESAIEAGGVAIRHWNEQSELVKILRRDFDLSNCSSLGMNLVLDGKRLGFL